MRGPRALSRDSLARKLSFLRNHPARKGEVLIILRCNNSLKDVDAGDFLRGGGTPIGKGGCSSSRLGCSGQNAIIFNRKGLVSGCTRRNVKKLYMFNSFYLLDSCSQSLNDRF